MRTLLFTIGTALPLLWAIPFAQAEDTRFIMSKCPGAELKTQVALHQAWNAVKRASLKEDVEDIAQLLLEKSVELCGEKSPARTSPAGGG